MRFLHTSDWHIGKTIRGRSRMDEYAAVLDDVGRIARQEKVDAILVSGDVYDQRSPSPDAERVVIDMMVRCYTDRIPVVLIPGNHDSAVRFSALAPLLHEIGVQVVTRVAPPDQGGQIEIPSRDGKASALIACVPFVPERRFADATSLFAAGESWYLSYSSGMSELLTAMTSSFRPDTVNVLMAHVFVDGAELGGDEREVTIGPDFAIPPSRLPANATYVALGHVHLPQVVRGSPSPARYAGSLLELDFGETDQSKSVFLIEAGPGRPARIDQVNISGGRRLLDLRGRIDDLSKHVGTLGDAFLRVFVETDGPVPGIGDRVRSMFPNAVAVYLEYPRGEEAQPSTSLTSLHPRDQFIAYYRRAHAVEPSDVLIDAFNEVLEIEQGGR